MMDETKYFSVIRKRIMQSHERKVTLLTSYQTFYIKSNIYMCVCAHLCLTFRWPQPFKGARALERAHKWVNAGANFHR